MVSSLLKQQMNKDYDRLPYLRVLVYAHGVLLQVMASRLAATRD